MNTLPEPYQQPYADQAGQPLPGWPTIPETPLTGPVELYGERQTIKYVPDAYGRMVPMLADQVAPLPERTPARDLTPGKLLDPGAQKIAAGGILAAGAGWGGGQLLLGAGQFVSALAGAGTLLLWVAVAIVASRVAPALLGAGRTTVNNTTNNHVTNENRWLGRSHTNIR